MANSFDPCFLVKLSIDGETFQVLVSGYDGAAHLPKSVRLGYCELSEGERDVLRNATEGEPLAPDLSRALLRVKRHLGGRVTSAKRLRKAGG